MFLLRRLTANSREKAVEQILTQAQVLNDKIEEDKSAHAVTLRVVSEEISRLSDTQAKLAKLTE